MHWTVPMWSWYCDLPERRSRYRLGWRINAVILYKHDLHKLLTVVILYLNCIFCSVCQHCIVTNSCFVANCKYEICAGSRYAIKNFFWHAHATPIICLWYLLLLADTYNFVSSIIILKIYTIYMVLQGWNSTFRRQIPRGMAAILNLPLCNLKKWQQVKFDKVVSE